MFWLITTGLSTVARWRSALILLPQQQTEQRLTPVNKLQIITYTDKTNYTFSDI